MLSSRREGSSAVLAFSFDDARSNTGVACLNPNTKERFNRGRAIEVQKGLRVYWVTLSRDITPADFVYEMRSFGNKTNKTGEGRGVERERGEERGKENQTEREHARDLARSRRVSVFDG